MEPAYYLTDLDGTLLQSDATLSSFTIHTLTEAIKNGTIISYATARSYTSSIHAVGEIPWKHPLVLYNGALLYDPVEQKVLDGHWLNNRITNDIIEFGRSYNILPLLFCLDSNDVEKVLHERLHRGGDVQFYNSRPNDPRFREVEQLNCPDTHRTLIITYIGLLDELEKIHTYISGIFKNQVHSHLMKDQYIPDHYFLEFSHAMANKQEGLYLWSKLVGCEVTEVTVFGDNLNDIGLFRAAGKKIAVSNAHPQILEMADQVVESNNDDGVARYLSDRFLGE
ncbi:MAG: HAD hydrolase family protein [Paenibacillaceae bacterium]